MTIETVALSKLVPSKANPRKAFDADAIEGLAASIKADGLLQNLVVRKKGKKFEIVSGNRRYRALTLLRERGDIEGDYPVTVEIRAALSGEDAVRLATVENIQREALAPMDEAEAFARMVTDGAELADIAAKAGVSEATVKRRLALAALCDEAKEAVRKGDVPLSVAEALTMGTADQQREFLAAIEAGEYYDADDVRAWLIREKPSVAIAIFPQERYTGTYTRDLFGADDATFFDDAGQFMALQTAAVDELAAQHRETAASVEVITAPGVAWWQYRQAEEDEAGGTVIHFAPSGRVEVRTGLVKQEVRASVRAATAEASKEKKPKPEYAGALLRHIAAHKTLAVQAALLTHPRRAKEIAVVQLMNAGDFGGSRIRLDTHFALTAFPEEAAQPKAYTAVEAVAAEFTAVLGIPEKDADGYDRGYRGAWERLARMPKEPVALYEAVKALSDDALDRVHVLLTTLAFGQGNIDALDDDADSLFNRVATDLGIDMAAYWRPDAAFLSRRSKDQLAEIARESGALPRLGLLKDYKKAGLVEALVRFFTRTDDEGARTWLPKAMRFAIRSADAAPEAAADMSEAA